jgi:outer membrane lipoprotein-sorting protein
VILSKPAGRARRATTAALLGISLATASACGARAPSLPTAGGTPFPEAQAAYAEATARCRGVRTLSAELALSGHAGGQKLRGRILAGFAEPGRVRLEAPAPFGRAVFTLVVRDGTATLVLNRERRVLRDAPPAELVEALTGVALGPDELRSVVAGCGLGVDQVASGESYPGEWATVASGGSRTWLRRVTGTWRVVAASRDTLQVRYDELGADRPAAVRLVATTRGAGTDLTLRLSQVDINVALQPDVFEVDVPQDATPITLDELRRGGPLGSGGNPASVARASRP